MQARAIVRAENYCQYLRNRPIRVFQRHPGHYATDGEQALSVINWLYDTDESVNALRGGLQPALQRRADVDVCPVPDRPQDHVEIA